MPQTRPFRTSLAAAFVLALATLPLSFAHAHPPDVGSLQKVISFDAAQLEAPESIVFDEDGNRFVSLALTGEIRKITPAGTQSTFARLPLEPPLTPCGSFIAIQGGLAIDRHGTLYVNLAACNPANRGVWRVSRKGAVSLVANLPLAALPNGIALRHGRLYIADSALPRIWTVPVDGGVPAVWIEDPRLAAPPGSPFPGANGLQIFDDEIYVSVSATGAILAVPFEEDDEPGTMRLHATLPPPLGCDDFAFDVRGSLYCTTDPFNRLVRVDPDGSSTVLLTAADGLDGPTSAAFGRLGEDRFNLYINNGAFPFFSTTHQPSQMRLRLAVPGARQEH